MSFKPVNAVVTARYFQYAGTVGSATAWISEQTGDLVSLDLRQVTQPNNMPVRLTREEAIELARFILGNLKD
jgi:hypothetical protein